MYSPSSSSSSVDPKQQAMPDGKQRRPVGDRAPIGQVPLLTQKHRGHPGACAATCTPVGRSLCSRNDIRPSPLVPLPACAFRKASHEMCA
jgi:hypothetical protein